MRKASSHIQQHTPSRVFHSSVNCFLKISIKKHNPKHIWPSNHPHTQKLVFVHSQMTGCPKSDKGGSRSPHSLFFNHPINCSSFLELPSFSREVILRSVRKAFWEDWLGFLGLFQSIQDELACINEALNAVHKTGLSPTVQLWPRLVHALFPTKFRHLVHQLLEALLLSLYLDEMLQLRVDRAQTRCGGRRGGRHPSAATRAETNSAPTHRPSRVSAAEPLIGEFHVLSQFRKKSVCVWGRGGGQEIGRAHVWTPVTL